MATFSTLLGLQSGIPASTVSGDTIDLSSYTLTGVSATQIANGGATVSLDGAGNLTSTSVQQLDLDAAGALSINSSAGVINVGNDAVNQNINIATAGTRTVTLGSATATLDLNSAGLTLDATTLSIDATDTSNLSVTGAALTISTITSGALSITSAGTASFGDGTGSLDFDGSGSSKLTIAGNAANAFSVEDTAGSPVTYFTIDSTTGQESVNYSVPAILTSQDGSTVVGQSITAGGTFSGGAPLAVNGTSGQYEAADANGAGTLSTVTGIALVGGTAGGGSVMVIQGIASVTFTGNVTTANIGAFAYLSATAGQATLTAPSTSGDRVYKIGVVVNANGTATAQVLVQPQFLYDVA